MSCSWVAPVQLVVPPDNFPFFYSFLLVVLPYSTIYLSCLFNLFHFLSQCSCYLGCWRSGCQQFEHKWCSLPCLSMTVSTLTLWGKVPEVACIARIENFGLQCASSHKDMNFVHIHFWKQTNEPWIPFRETGMQEGFPRMVDLASIVCKSRQFLCPTHSC